MNWTDWNAFFLMGGYGLYVWGSSFFVVLAIAIEMWSLRTNYRRLSREAKWQTSNPRSDGSFQTEPAVLFVDMNLAEENDRKLR